MAITLATLTAGAVVGASVVTLYTAPALTHAKVTAAVFTNPTGAPTALTIQVSRTGGTTLTLISAMPLSAGQAYPSPELSGLVLNPGDTVTAQATVAASINVQMSGLTF